MILGLNSFERDAVSRLDKNNLLENSESVLFLGFEASKLDLTELFGRTPAGRIKHVHFLYNGSSNLSTYLENAYPSLKYTYDKTYCTDAVVQYQKYWIDRLGDPKPKVLSWGNGRIGKLLKKDFVDSCTNISARKFNNSTEIPEFNVLVLNTEKPLPVPLLKAVKPNSLVINTARGGVLKFTSVLDLIIFDSCTYVTDVDDFNIPSERFIKTDHIAYLTKTSIDKLIRNALRLAK